MRVLELSDGEGSAAYAGKLFARFGSEVFKVESPSRPTPERALDLYLNGGKRRVAADFRVDADRALIDELARSCDIVVTDAEARDVRAFDLLGLGGARVGVSITPFGLSGPYADCAWTPATVLALGGYTFFMGDADKAPLTMPGNYTNYQAGGYAYIAALASARRSSGAESEPVRIEVSMLECLASLHQMTDTRYIDGGHIRRRHGSSMEVVLNSMLPVKDGYVGLSVNPAFWEPFMLMLGHPEACEPDHPFGTPLGRTLRQAEVDVFLIEAMKEWTAQRIFIEGQETWRVPTGRLSSMADVLADPHLAARGFFRPIEEVEGVVTPASGFRIMGEPYPAEAAPLESLESLPLRHESLVSLKRTGTEPGSITGGRGPLGTQG